MVMGSNFLAAYSLLLIKTCHRRGAFAMGGMAAQIPVKTRPRRQAMAFAKVRADKQREATDGHDGTWVAHPDLVPVAMEVFDRLMPSQNQLNKLRDDVNIIRDDMIQVQPGSVPRRDFAEYPRRRSVHRGMAAWPRRRAALQSHGRRSDSRNLARADLAVALPQGQARRRPRGDAGRWSRR